MQLLCNDYPAEARSWVQKFCTEHLEYTIFKFGPQPGGPNARSSETGRAADTKHWKGTRNVFVGKQEAWFNRRGRAATWVTKAKPSGNVFVGKHGGVLQSTGQKKCRHLAAPDPGEG